MRSRKFLDLSDTCQPPKNLDPDPGQCQQPQSEPVCPVPAAPAAPCSLNYSLERTYSSRFSNCSCRRCLSPWFSMTQSKSPKLSRPHSDSTSSTPVEEAWRGQARSVWTDAGPRAWRRLAPGGAVLPSPHTRGPSHPPKHQERLSGPQPPVPPAGPTHGSGLGHLTADKPQGHCVYCAVTTPSVPASLPSGAVCALLLGQ